MLVEKCTGCMACYNKCEYNAIQIIQNEKGFYVPKIEKEKCIECGACKNVCPEINVVKKNKYKECYASWTKDRNTRKNSTSGGIFVELAKNVLSQDGIVVGAMFNEKLEVVHEIIRNVDELKKIQGSKYVQSKLNKIYISIKEELQNGKKVLFSGVACQIAGLKKYLNKEYDNLITVDVLCHGAPSPLIFEEYLKRKKIENITNIRFRYKKPSWTVFSMRIDYNNNNKYQKNTFKDEYIRMFLDDYITNDVCANCKYVGENRISDITLADFWGYISDKVKFRNNEKGISLVLLNTKKGKEIFELIKDKVVVIKKEFDEAKNGNQCLNRPFNKNVKYDEFWNCYLNEGYDVAMNKFYKKSKMTLKRKISLTFNNVAYMMPKKIRYKLIELRKKSK